MVMNVSLSNRKVSFKAIHFDLSKSPSPKVCAELGPLRMNPEYKRILFPKVEKGGRFEKRVIMEQVDNKTMKIDLDSSRPGNPDNPQDQQILFDLLQKHNFNPRIVA
jgi:hypothetical protein